MATREYPTFNPETGKTEIWATDDAGNFWKVGDSNSPSSTPAQSSNPYADPYWQALQRSQAESNQKRFDEQIRQFGARLGLDEKQLAEMSRQFERSLYSNLAQSLLGTATQLRGPANWLDYATYTSGGKNIFKALFGDRPVPNFSAPTGVSEPMTIEKLLRDLGLIQGTGTGAVPGSYQTVNGPRTIEQMEQELRAAGWPGGEDVPTAYARTTKGAVTPIQAGEGIARTQGGGVQTAISTMASRVQDGAIGPTEGQRLREPGGTIGPIQSGQQLAPPGGTIGPTQPSQQLGQPGGTIGPTEPSQRLGEPNNQVPLPHQINPLVWDSLSDNAKLMILASAEKGNTPSGAWEAGDFLRQLNAARPQGTAPRRTYANWGLPISAF